MQFMLNSILGEYLRLALNTFVRSERSRSLSKNIIGSFIVKGISVLISYINLPIVLNYLDSEKYGVWLTLVSFVGWFSFFDLGISNGLKNKLIEARANNNTKEMKQLVSSAYYYSILALFLLCVIFFVFSGLIDWNIMFNVSSIQADELLLVIRMTFILFVINLILNQIVSVMQAFQLVALSNTIVPLGNLIALIIIYILSVTVPPSLWILALVLSGAPVLVSLVYNIILFRTRFLEIHPEFYTANFSTLKKILSLSLKFFFIQMTSVIMFTSTNFIISQMTGPKDVTVYNVASKLMNVPVMIFTLLVQPFWPYISDAYFREDFNWIKNLIKLVIIISIFFIAIQFVVLFYSNELLNVWLGNRVDIPLSLFVVLNLLSIYSIYFAVYDSCANAFGKMNLSMYIIIFKAFLYIPFTVWSVSNLGIIGIPIALLVLNLPSSIIQLIQVKRILNRSARGVWNA